MTARVFSHFVIGVACLGLFCGGPASARLNVSTQMMTPQYDAMEGLYDLVIFLKSAGLRTTDLETILTQLVVHEEGVQAAGVFLQEGDEELTITTTRTQYGDFNILNSDAKIHLILKKPTIDALVERNFSFVEGAENPASAAIQGLLHAFISSSRCVRGNEVEEALLIHTLTGHVLDKISVDLLAQNHQDNKARQYQSNVTAMISDVLTENPQWEQCYAALGHLFVSVDFDLFPSDDPVFEGTTIEEQYLSKGVTFYIADTLLPPDRLVIDDASGEIDNFFHGMSLPNVLTYRGFVPGSSSSLGCESDMKINFVDPSSQQPTTVSSASLRWFAGVSSPVTTPLPVRLIAKDPHGKVVAIDTFQLQELFFAPASFSLRVFAPGRPQIASVETQGITGNGVCVAFDNLAFWPPLQ